MLTPLVLRMVWSSIGSRIWEYLSGHVTLDSLAPVAQPSGLPVPQTPTICKHHLATVLPAPETCPGISLAVQPLPWAHAGVMEQPWAHVPGYPPHGSWQEQELSSYWGWLWLTSLLC